MECCFSFVMETFQNELRRVCTILGHESIFRKPILISITKCTMADDSLLCIYKVPNSIRMSSGGCPIFRT